MDIIAREIAKREEVINAFEEKKARLDDLRQQVADLENEINNTNVDYLKGEIDELRAIQERLQ